jgi:hypothetical protein
MASCYWISSCIPCQNKARGQNGSCTELSTRRRPSVERAAVSGIVFGSAPHQHCAPVKQLLQLVVGHGDEELVVIRIRLDALNRAVQCGYVLPNADIHPGPALQIESAAIGRNSLLADSPRHQVLFWLKIRYRRSLSTRSSTTFPYRMGVHRRPRRQEPQGSGLVDTRHESQGGAAFSRRQQLHREWGPPSLWPPTPPR